MNTGPGELSPGDILQNRYEIISKIGGGGMGTVYKASDNRVANRRVAIKEMKQASLTTAQLELAYKRFEREAAILSLVQSEHLPRIYHFFEEAGRYYLVMQFIEGETLLQQVSTNQVPVLVAVDYALQLCDVLTHLHTRRDPIIFRDLKPSNIIIQPDGHLFLVDFGIARNFRAGKTSDTEFFGTPGFMAPEMSLTQTDARSDLFSLGVTLHFALTGKLPEYVERNRVLTPVLASNAEVPAQLYALIAKLVQMAPDARPQSAAEVKSQLERIYRHMLSSQVKMGQIGASSVTGRPLTFYQQPTVAGTRYQRGWRSPLGALENLPGFLLSGLAFLLQPLAAGASKAASVVMSAEARRDAYDRYLFLRVRLNNTGVWTTRFLALLLSMLIGSIALSVFIAAHFGASIYHVESGLAFVLLVTIILSGGQLNNAVARNILLCTGFCVTIVFLILLASTGLQTTPDSPAQPMTLNLLMVYTLVTLTLIALLGNIAIRKQYVAGSKPAHGFTRLSHAGIAAVAGVCFLLQLAFGNNEQLIFFPDTFRPFGIALSPSATTNIVPLLLLGCVGIISLLRISRPFKGFDLVMLFTLCLLYVPAQYTFGLGELSHAFPEAFHYGLVRQVFNLLIQLVPLVLAILAFFPLPDHMAWIRLLPLFAVSLGVAWLQGYLGGQEPFSALSSNSQQLTGTMPRLALFGQIVFFGLAIAGALLFTGIIFYRRAPARPKWQYNSTANTSGTSRIGSAADRIGMLGVTLGCGAVQWAFWQSMLQNASTLSTSAQSANSLYAPLLSLGVGYTVMGISLLTTGIVAVSALFNLSQTYPRLAGLVKFLDRVTVLGITIIGLLLFSAFGNHGGWLAKTLDLGQGITSGASSASGATIHYSLILIILIALFGAIALFRLTRAFGRVERILLLLCGVGAMLMLTDTRDVQQLPLLSANMQQAAGNFFSSLNTDQVVAFSLLVAALLSFAWLLSTTIVSDRLALGMVFGLVALLALLATMPAQPGPILLAFIVMIQGVLIAAKVERVRRGNAPNAQQ